MSKSKHLDPHLHFQERFRERLKVDLTFEEIDNLSEKIISGDIPLAFSYNRWADIYTYNFKIKKNNHYRHRCCYILFDRDTGFPRTVYCYRMMDRLIRKMK